MKFLCVIALIRQELISLSPFHSLRGEKKHNTQFFSAAGELFSLSQSHNSHERIFFCNIDRKSCSLIRIDRITWEWNFAVVTKFNLTFSPFHIGKTYEIYFCTLDNDDESCSTMMCVEWEEKSQSNTEHSTYTHEMAKWSEKLLTRMRQGGGSQS